jgi:hypothetical protein
MYIFGGLSEEAKLLCDLHVFDLERMVWKQLNPAGTWPCGRINHSAHILGNFFVVFGGYDGKLRLNDLFLLNLETCTWTVPLVHGTPPSRRLGHASVVAGDKLVIFGGDDGNKERELLNDLHIFDLPSMKWYVPEVGGCPAPQGRTHASACVTSEDQMWILDGSNSQKVKLDEIYRLDMSSLYLFQKMWIDRASRRIIEDLVDCCRKLQVRTHLSSHLASKRNSPPSTTRPRKSAAASSSSAVVPLSPAISFGPSSSLSSSSSSALVSAVAAPFINGSGTGTPSDPSGAVFLGGAATSPPFVVGPSPLDGEETSLVNSNGEIPVKRSKAQRRTERAEHRDREKESLKFGLVSSSSSSAILNPSSENGGASGAGGGSSDDRPSRSPKKRRNKTVARSTSRRETSPTPIPISPLELSPTTSPRGTRDDFGVWQAIDDEYIYDGSGQIVSFADPSSEETEEEEAETALIQRVRRTLSAIKQSFHSMAIEKDTFRRLRQERLAQIEEVWNRDSTQGHELNRLLQQQKGRVTLNVGGSLFTTSITTLTKYPDSMLATMFSGRHTLLPESDGTYFIDRDGTYFRYILNYLRCGDDAVLEAKPSVLIEILAEARFYQLEGLKEALQVILAEADLEGERIVEY